MCVFGGERGRYRQRVNLKKNKQQKVRLERERRFGKNCYNFGVFTYAENYTKFELAISVAGKPVCLCTQET